MRGKRKEFLVFSSPAQVTRVWLPGQLQFISEALASRIAPPAAGLASLGPGVGRIMSSPPCAQSWVFPGGLC